MSGIVIPMHKSRAAKRYGVGLAAYMAAQSQRLSPIQCEAIVRRARQDYECGRSPARAVADAWARARQMGRSA